jgi:hypothetical protein
MTRRFPPPWSVEVTPNYLIVRDANGQALNYARRQDLALRHVHYFGKFPSEKDAIDWINAHPRLTKPEDTMDEPQIDL